MNYTLTKVFKTLKWEKLIMVLFFNRRFSNGIRIQIIGFETFCINQSKGFKLSKVSRISHFKKRQKKMKYQNMLKENLIIYFTHLQSMFDNNVQLFF